MTTCSECNTENKSNRFFCTKCGTLLDKTRFSDENINKESEMKILRIIENLRDMPHTDILWNDTIDLYTKRVEKFKAMMSLPEMDGNLSIVDKMNDFLDLCIKPEFQVAFVGTIKTGKSTLINSLLGHNYASMAVTPETAALTKFRASESDYVQVTFYNKNEWKELWASRTSAADAFMKEYNELNAEKEKDNWIGHDVLKKVLPNDKIEEELTRWSSSKRAEHYFVKEIEVGISSLPKDFPRQVVLVDTPGLMDPVAYRSEITKNYIRKANAVFVCVDAQKVEKSEIETISSVFSFSSHNKSKVHIIATHWDKLNNPIKHWEEQKEWLCKRIVGKGFFDDIDMAKTNVMHSAAYIYNLCREYDNLDNEELLPLKQFALIMGIDINNLKYSLFDMMNLTNIGAIKEIVNNILAKNYQKLLYEDIKKTYVDIIHTLRRIAEEKKAETMKIYELSNSDLQSIEDQMEEQKRNYDEITRCKEQLTQVLKSVEISTQKRLNKILAQLQTTSNQKGK